MERCDLGAMHVDVTLKQNIRDRQKGRCAVQTFLTRAALVSESSTIVSSLLFACLVCIWLVSCQDISDMGVITASIAQSLPKLGELGIVVLPGFLLAALMLMLSTESNENVSSSGYTSSFMFSGTVLGALVAAAWLRCSTCNPVSVF